MLFRIDAPTPEIMMTIAVVTGGFAVATALHVSGPLSMVVAGLLVGNQARAYAMSDRTRSSSIPSGR